jgi:hypothetical protein
MKPEEFGHKMDELAKRALDNRVTALCISMASFIAEIDKSSADVAAYLEQRLDAILRHPAIREHLIRAAKDERKLIRNESKDQRSLEADPKANALNSR